MNSGTISLALWAGDHHGNRGCVLMNCILGDWLKGSPPPHLSVWIAAVPATWQGPLQKGSGLRRGDGSSLCRSCPAPCGVVHNSSQCCRDKMYSHMIPQPHYGPGVSLPPQTNTFHLKHTHTHTHTHNSSGLSAICFANLSNMWRLPFPLEA